MSGHERKTKIIATLGPASSSLETIRNLARAGADVFRLNFSHGSHEDHLKNAQIVRAVENEIGKSLDILMDLQGPKIRIGAFMNGYIVLKEGSEFRLDLDDSPGDDNRVFLPHVEIFSLIRAGTEVLLDDGKIRLSVVNNDGSVIKTRVISGGRLSDKKGLNIPNITLPIRAITDKDKRDLTIVNEVNPDLIAISFVQSASDIVYAKKLICNQARVIAKIERAPAVEQIESISKEADMIMVARGDLGVEMNYEMIPILQSRIIAKTKENKKPVIVATQMLESMCKCNVPTRAEVTDVAFAVASGADYVMLSAETASGGHAVECVEVMSKIASTIEMESKSHPEFSKDVENFVSKFANIS
jgi:pyruvate kinase